MATQIRVRSEEGRVNQCRRSTPAPRNGGEQREGRSGTEVTELIEVIEAIEVIEWLIDSIEVIEELIDSIEVTEELIDSIEVIGVGVAVGVNRGSRTEIPPEEATRQLTVIQPSAAIALGTNKAGRPGVYKFLISSLSSLLGKTIKL